MTPAKVARRHRRGNVAVATLLSLSYGSFPRTTHLPKVARHTSWSRRLTSFDLRADLARTHPHAFAWAVRCCRGDRREAEDVLHVAYCKVLYGRARFDGVSTFRTWLFGVIQRTAREERRWGWLRLARLERWWSREVGHESSSMREPAQAAASEEDRMDGLREALPRLSPRQREVLHLVFYQELTIQEAAQVMGMPVGTARTHYERGKARLRRLLRPGERG